MRCVNYRGKWAALFWQDGKKYRRSTGLAATPENRAKAEAIIEGYRADISRPIGADCAAIMQAYLDDFTGIDKARLVTCWKSLQWDFAALLPDQITRQTCRAYVARRLDEGRMIGTVRKELTVIRAAVNWHEKHNRATFELPPMPQPRDVWITKDEFRKLLAATDAFHLHVFLHLAICTVARKEAILTLPWDLVDFDRGEINLGFKAGGKNRGRVALTDACRDVLMTAQRAAQTPYVVEYDGQPVKSLKRAFNTARTNAGLNCTIHDLRRSGARWMIEAGVPMEKVSQLLGHSDIDVTRRVYARFEPGWMDDARRALEV